MRNWKIRRLPPAIFVALCVSFLMNNESQVNQSASQPPYPPAPYWKTPKKMEKKRKERKETSYHFSLLSYLTGRGEVGVFWVLFWRSKDSLHPKMKITDWIVVVCFCYHRDEVRFPRAGRGRWGCRG